MKNQLLFTLLALLSFPVYSQYSRSIYSEETIPRRHSSLYEINGETTLISIRESSNDTLRVTLIDIDSEGETNNYRMHEYSPFNIYEAVALSGTSSNSTGEVTLCILLQNSTSMEVNYINIDPISGTFNNYFSLPEQYRKGFSRTRAKGDSLITYLAKFNTSGISRISRSLSNTGFSSELANPNSTFSGTLFQNSVSMELLIDGSDEYTATHNQIIKRTAPNNYIETSYSGFLYAPNIAINTSGELFALHRISGDYTLHDANLTISNSGNILELQGSPTGLTEIYALPNNGIRVWTNRGTTPTVIDLSSSYTVDNMRTTRNFPLNQFILDGMQYVVGYDVYHSSLIDEDGNLFQSNPSNLTIVADDLSSDISQFIEYNQELSSDKIQFLTNHGGRSFTNTAFQSEGFLFKQNNSSRRLIHSATSNAIGSDINGFLLGTGNSYTSSTATGPYCTPGNYSLEVMDKYNRGYYVNAEMIESHIANITSGNPSYVIPFGIKEWPAHGNVLLGQAADLANFIDQNGNGTYEPELGDYPAIYGDQCLLNIYHEHANSVNSASIETHQYYFTFDCDTEEAVENAVFIRSHKFNRDQILFNTYFGNYVDFDLGNSNDDYIGTNVELGMIYAYNGDNFDETNGGFQGFQDTIPAVGLLTLQGAKLDSDGIDNPNTVAPISNGSINGVGFSDGVLDNEYYTIESSYFYPQITGNVTSLSDWKNVMRGRNPNGSYKIINGANVRHDYFGTSDPLFYTSDGVDHGNNHSEQNLANSPGDRRMICGSGPSTWQTVDTMILINAYVVGVDTVNLSPLNSLDRLFEHGQTLRDFFAQNSDVCGNSFNIYEAENQLSVDENEMQQIILYPNPANLSFSMRGITGEAHVQIIDLNGRIVSEEIDFVNGQEVSIEDLENAVYLVSVEDEMGRHIIRLVKR